MVKCLLACFKCQTCCCSTFSQVEGNCSGKSTVLSVPPFAWIRLERQKAQVWPGQLSFRLAIPSGKHSLDMCAEIIMGLKAHQNKEAGVEEDSGDNVEEESEEQDGGGHQVIPENEIGDEAHLEEDGLDVREESEGGDELPDIPEHGNGQEEIFIEGEPVTKC